jgi:tRNA-2-methylthio-N6-dimethylallyladenosine synthase
MYSLLEMANITPVMSPEQADLIIVNSCSIREKAVHKVYSEVGSYRRLKNRKPHLKIGVGGCVGSQEKERLIKDAPLIDFVFGTDNIDALPSLIDKVFNQNQKKVVETNFRHREPYHVETLVRNPGVATFVNITKGCDNFCTFCVVPYTRGREKSRPFAHILEDVQKLVARGVKEVTLLGQNVNSYESECGVNFAELLKRISLETNVQRVRFTTSHPKDFDQDLVDKMYESQPKVCEYIHLPFQSGSTRILEMMNRGYTREEYLAKIKMIKAAIPNVVLSSDVIVGFPSETEQDFQDTLDMIHEGAFETIFAFKYSPRPFTKAAGFQDQIDEDVKSERLDRLFKAHALMAGEIVKRYEGMILEVLIEEFHEKRGNLSGRSTQNKLVYFKGPEAMVGQTVKVLITKANPAVLHGDLVPANASSS